MKKICLVTGSTSGIGKAVAKQLLDQGNIVIINSNVPISENFIKDEFENSQDVHFIQADISKTSDVINLAGEIKKQFGKLDYLVANAGIMPLPCNIETVTEENISSTINVNLKGTFWTLKYLGKLISDTSTNGAIVALTSVDGLIGEPYGVIYSATKAGIISLIKSFARHFKKPIVRVNGVAPGLINTPLSDSTGEDPAWTTDLSIIQRVGEPDEIANLIVFLLSDKASYITGQIIAADGGFTLK